MRITTPGCGSWLPRAAAGSPPSTVRIWPSATSRDCAEDAASAAALGYDGKWVLHPGQVDVVNEVFAPDQESYDRAESILDAYAHATEVQQTGAVMLGDEMIDEASRKLALVTAAKGRAAGLARTGGTAPGAVGASSAEHPPGGERLGEAAGQG